MESLDQQLLQVKLEVAFEVRSYWCGALTYLVFEDVTWLFGCLDVTGDMARPVTYYLRMPGLF